MTIIASILSLVLSVSLYVGVISPTIHTSAALISILWRMYPSGAVFLLTNCFPSVHRGSHDSQQLKCDSPDGDRAARPSMGEEIAATGGGAG